MKLLEFFKRKFMRIVYIQQTIVVPYQKKGQKRLTVIYLDKSGMKQMQKNFIVEHMADENWEITDKTLHDEIETFKEPTLL